MKKQFSSRESMYSKSVNAAQAETHEIRLKNENQAREMGKLKSELHILQHTKQQVAMLEAQLEQELMGSDRVGEQQRRAEHFKVELLEARGQIETLTMRIVESEGGGSLALREVVIHNDELKLKLTEETGQVDVLKKELKRQIEKYAAKDKKQRSELDSLFEKLGGNQAYISELESKVSRLPDKREEVKLKELEMRTLTLTLTLIGGKTKGAGDEKDEKRLLGGGERDLFCC